MLKRIQSLDEYKEVYSRLEQEIDRSSERDDMIIFDELTKCLSEIKQEYAEFEKQRIAGMEYKNYII